MKRPARRGGLVQVDKTEMFIKKHKARTHAPTQTRNKPCPLYPANSALPLFPPALTRPSPLFHPLSLTLPPALSRPPSLSCRPGRAPGAGGGQSLAGRGWVG